LLFYYHSAFCSKIALKSVEWSVEFVIKVCAGTEAVGLFEWLDLFVAPKVPIKSCYKMLSVKLNEGPVCG
jgi:hypothetical protein